MRERFVLGASVFALIFAVALSPSARAQEETRRGTGEKQSAHMQQTIHGVIAGITAEGEVFFNHQTSTATKAEAAFLTVVGSPIHSELAAAHENRAATTGGEREHAQSGHRRHNVYIVWLTPKTKVCEMMHQSSASGAADRAKSDQAKKEVAFDDLEVGDRVEVAFTSQEESAAHANVHQTEHMRRKHGRHRTHVGYATAITIVQTPEHGPSGSDGGAKEREGAK